MNIYQVITLCITFFLFGGVVQYFLSFVTIMNFRKELLESNKAFENAINEFRELSKENKND